MNEIWMDLSAPVFFKYVSDDNVLIIMLFFDSISLILMIFVKWLLFIIGVQIFHMDNVLGVSRLLQWKTCHIHAISDDVTFSIMVCYDYLKYSVNL